MKWKTPNGFPSMKVTIALALSISFVLATFAMAAGPSDMQFTSEDKSASIGCPKEAYEGYWADAENKNISIEVDPIDLDWDPRAGGPAIVPIVQYPGHPIVNTTDETGVNSVWLGLHGGTGGEIKGIWFFSFYNPFDHPILVRISLNMSASTGLDRIVDYSHHVAIEGDGNKTRVLYKNGDQKNVDWCVKLKPDEIVHVYADILLKADSVPYYVRIVHDEHWRPWIPQEKK